MNDDGSVTLVYFRATKAETYFATSADGLTFTSETATGFAQPNAAADPFLMRLPNGDVRMYYNWGDDKTGTVSVAHRRGFSLAGP